jgi:hypothetical protein
VTIQEILAFVRALPPQERLRVVERIVHEVAEAENAASPAPPAVWGDASDEEFEAFLAAVSSARSADTLRDGDGPRGR